jgi:hypothetical protein
VIQRRKKCLMLLSKPQAVNEVQTHLTTTSKHSCRERRLTSLYGSSRHPTLPAMQAANEVQTLLTTIAKRGWREPRSTSLCWRSRSASVRWTAMPATSHSEAPSSPQCSETRSWATRRAPS